MVAVSDGPAADNVNQPRSDAYHTSGFLFSDLRNYTRYAERHGDEAAAVLLARYRTLVRDAVALHSGAEVRTEGDSFYVVFPSASSAVRCGLAILAAAASPPDGAGPISVGVGVHAGEAVATDEGYVGSAVNTAARLSAAAKAGELLVSETVRGLTRTVLPVHFAYRGRRRLKGLAEPVAVYAVTEQPQPSRVASAIAHRRAAILALLLAALIAVAALAALVVPSRSPASGPPTNAAAGSATPDTHSPLTTSTPTSPATLFPRTLTERRLLEQVPVDFQAGCRPSDDPLPSAVASIVCALPFGAQADVVWYDRFKSRPELSVAMEQAIDNRALPDTGCTPPTPEGLDNWGTSLLLTGRRACFEQDGAAWIWWTYEEDLIMARVVRHDAAWPELFDWWRRYSILLRLAPPD